MVGYGEGWVFGFCFFFLFGSWDVIGFIIFGMCLGGFLDQLRFALFV